MSAQSNQAVYIGLAVTAAVALVGYVVLSSKSETGDSGSGKSVESRGRSTKSSSNESRSKSPVRTTKDATETTTPVASNTSGRSSDGGSPASEKAIHAKIEELDKQGKKLFKEKKVGLEVCCNMSYFCPALYYNFNLRTLLTSSL